MKDVALYVANGYLQAVFNRAVIIEKSTIEPKAEFQRTKEQVQAGVLPEGDLEMEVILVSQEQLLIAENQFMAKLSLVQLLR